MKCELSSKKNGVLRMTCQVSIEKYYDTTLNMKYETPDTKYKT